MPRASIKSRANRKRTATKIARGAATKNQKKVMPKQAPKKVPKKVPVKKVPVKKVPKKAPVKKAPKKAPVKKIPKGKLGLLAAGIGTVIASANAMRGKPKSFGDAFKKARKTKGPDSTFTHKGKKYSTVTKDQIKKAGFTNLRDYLNSKNKK